MEYISRAAIRFTTDLVTGTNHAVCLAKVKNATEQGFMATEIYGTCERFVDRKEALEIAINAGQNIDKHNPKDQLLSEDLRHDKLYQNQ
jgi:hypothetical protein